MTSMTTFIGLVLLLITYTAFAQTPSFFTQATTPTSNENKNVKNVMTPEQFQNAVSSLNQQSTDKLNQQIVELHAAQRYPKSLPPSIFEEKNKAAPKQQPSPTEAVTTTTAPAPAQNITTQPSANVPPPQQPQQQPVVQPQVKVPPAPPPNYGIQQPPAPTKQGQPQTYTGFGAGTEDKQGKSSTDTSTGSSGWNIQY